MVRFRYMLKKYAQLGLKTAIHCLRFLFFTITRLDSFPVEFWMTRSSPYFTSSPKFRTDEMSIIVFLDQSKHNSKRQDSHIHESVF